MEIKPTSLGTLPNDLQPKSKGVATVCRLTTPQSATFQEKITTRDHSLTENQHQRRLGNNISEEQSELCTPNGETFSSRIYDMNNSTHYYSRLNTESRSRLKFSKKIIETSNFLVVATKQRANSIAGYLFGEEVGDENNENNVGDVVNVFNHEQMDGDKNNAANDEKKVEYDQTFGKNSIFHSPLSDVHPVNLLLRELSSSDSNTTFL